MFLVGLCEGKFVLEDLWFVHAIAKRDDNYPDNNPKSTAPGTHVGSSNDE
jgi:hypothetical protein